MDKRAAYRIATSWAGLLKADPTCFFHFRPDDARPANETHRLACIAYTRDCIRIAKRDIQKARTAQESLECSEELSNLEDLLHWFKHCELWTQS